MTGQYCWAANNQLAGNYQGTWPSVDYLQAANLNNPTTTNPTPTRFDEDPALLGAGAEIIPPPTPFNQQTWFVDPYLKNSYMIAWNFGVQHQLSSSMLIEANYVGSHSLRTGTGGFRNTALTPGPGDITDRQPFPYALPTFMDKSVGRASYHGFQLKAERRTSRGLSYIISYTFSETRNLGCDNFFGGGAGGCNMPNPYDLEANWGPAGYDLPHNLSASWVYQLPFGKGQRYASQGGALDYFIGGWSINGIFTARSGTPFFIANGLGDTANTGGAEDRADYLGGDLYPSTRTRELFFNTDQFVTPAPFTFGNSGRNMLRNPHVTNWDFSTFKSFPLPITEATRLDFRAEFFNGFNQSPLAIGYSDYTGNPNFGRVFATALREREIQFALKLHF